MKRTPRRLIISGVDLGAVRPAGIRQIDVRTGRILGRFTGVAQSAGMGAVGGIAGEEAFNDIHDTANIELLDTGGRPIADTRRS